MQVGEIAELTGASIRSIRYYEQAGLIRAARRDNGYRDFDAAAVDRVRVIRELLETGFTIEEIASLASCLQEACKSARCCSQTVSLYRHKLEKIERQVDTLTRLRERIEERIATLEPC